MQKIHIPDTQKIESFQELQEMLRKLSANQGMVYRGQSNEEWDLVPSLFRKEDWTNLDISGHLDRFRKYLIGKIKDVDKFSQKEIWAIGQHYGLQTPLLDWTVSPAIALFFAFQDEPTEGIGYTSIYELNAEEVNKSFCHQFFLEARASNPELFSRDQDGIRITENVGRDLLSAMENGVQHKLKHVELDAILYRAEEKYIRFVSPRKYNNDRLISQRGLFSQSMVETSIEDILKNNDQINLIRKYCISTSLRDEAMRILDSYNINEMTIYPDFFGVAKYSNRKIVRNNTDDPLPNNTYFWL